MSGKPQSGGGVVVVGSVNADLTAHVDRLPRPGETVTGGRFTEQGGGKGANQAVAAARAGAPVTFVGAVGDDELGREAVDQLAREGIDVAGIARLSGERTGVALIVVDSAGENQIAVASGANWALTAAHVEGVLAHVPVDRSGVLLVNLEIPVGAVAGATAWAARVGFQVVLNPAPAQPLEGLPLDARAVLTPNRAEATLLSGADDPASGARALAESTGADVIVTLGAEGVLASIAGELHDYRAPRVAAVDTTGAGDTFSGALAAELALGAPLREAVQRAQAAAALSVTVVGAREGAPSRAAVDRFLERAPTS